MHDYPIFIFAALLIFGFGLFSRASERSPISAAMVFVAVGMIAGPIGLGYLREGINAPLVKVLAEVTLVLVLFVDASTLNLYLKVSYLKVSNLDGLLPKACCEPKLISGKLP